MLAQLDDLRTNGPSDTEFDAAIETVRQQLDLFSNEQINNEVLSVLTDPGGASSLDDFLDQSAQLVDITAADTQRYLQVWLPADQYIEVQVRPR